MYHKTSRIQPLSLRRDTARQVVEADLFKHPLTVETYQYVDSKWSTVEEMAEYL
jgi:hypothetical protein